MARDNDSRGRGTNRGLQLATMAAVGLLLVAGTAWATPAEVSRVGDQFEVRATASFDEADLTIKQGDDFAVVQLGDAGLWNVPGEPQLPAVMVRVALPAGMTATGVRVLETTTADVPGSYQVSPGQPLARCSDAARDLLPPDPTVYASNDAYPGLLAELIDQTDLAGQSVALVRVYPVQYTPASGALTLHTSLRLAIDGVTGYVCGDYLSPQASTSAQQRMTQLLTGSVINPEDVALALDAQAVPQSRGVAAGHHEYVIITQSSWVDDFQPLADWKLQKGLSATIVTTTWIYNDGGYSGTNADKIRAFVQDAYNNWGLQFLLLGGDTNIVPYGTAYYNDDSIPNDTYYGDFDGDWTGEVYVGRAPVRDSAAVATFIAKSFMTERTPPLTNYAKTVTMLGFDLNAYNSREGQNCKEDIISLYVPPTWTVREEYDSESGTHKTDSINYINQGGLLVNHIDHSSTTVMGVGSVNHSQYLGNTEMSALTNGDRQSLLYSIGCYCGNYASTTCVAESYVRNPNGGGSFIGNSRYGWYIPGSGNGASLRYDRAFFQSALVEAHPTVGECFTDHRNDAYEGGTNSKYIYTELTLLGDPDQPLWLYDPGTLVVQHAATLPVNGQTSFPVQVNHPSGPPIRDALVCLYKDGDVYETDITGMDGLATFWFTPTTTGDMTITVTRSQYLPVESTAQVVVGPTDPQACCFADASCQDLLEADCLAQGGTPAGNNSVCAGTYCPGPPEACCFADDGSCSDLEPADCAAQGGTPQGSGTDCATTNCPQPPDPRVVDITLVPSVNPNNVCPGDTFTVEVLAASIDGDLMDIRLLQFDNSLTSGLTINSVTYDLQLTAPLLYLTDTANPTGVVQAAYTESYRVPGYIVDLTDTPQLIAELNVTYLGGDAELNVMGDPGAPVDQGLAFRAGFDPVLLFRQAEGNVSGGTLTFSQGPCTDLHIIASDPGDGWVDARVPADAQTGTPQGWTSLQLTFNGSPGNLTSADFSMAEVCLAGNCDGVPPAIDVVLPVSGNVVLVTLDRPIDPAAWTTIAYLGGDANDVVRLGFLPADADTSLTANTFDVLTEIDLITAAQGGSPVDQHVADIDRSGTISLNDLLVLIDLLNGAGVYDPYLAVSLPPMP